jgi:hypothetical protein
MAAPQYVNLNTPYDAQLAALQRQQKYAELLSQQGAEPIDVQTVNGIPTPISPFQGLAKVFQSGMGGYLAGKATKDQAALEASDNAALLDALKNRSTTADVSTEGTNTTLQMPRTANTTPGGVSPGPYSLDLALAPVTVSGYQRSPSELANYDLTQAGSAAMSKPNRDMFLKSYTADQADVDALNKITPQVNSMLADPTISAPIKSSLASMLAAGDTTGITKYMGDIRSKNILSPKDQAELDDQNTYLRTHPGSTLQDYAAQGAGLKATAEQTAAWPFKVQQSALDQKREENLASFTAGMSNSPPVQIGYTGPDGEDVQVAATWNRKLGTYVNASTMQPINNVKDLRVIGNATGGGRSAAMAGRVSTAALDATTDIQNLSGIGTGASMGLFTNVLNTPASALGRALTTQEVQDTKVTMAGLSRAMSLLGSGGMQGSDAVMKSFDALQPQVGDTMFTTMRKLGSFRQQAINGMDAALASPMYSPAQKAQLREAKAKIITAVPWVPKDVQELENKGQTGTSMGEIFSARLGKKPNSGGTTKTGVGFQILGQ